MITFPSCNMIGKVVSVMNVENDRLLGKGHYKTVVILSNAKVKNWGKCGRVFVQTTVARKNVRIKVGDMVGCTCFEDMGHSMVNNECLQGYEMNTNFKKLKD